MIRYLIRNDVKVLQWYDGNTWQGWTDVPEITENDALIAEQQEKERQRLENEEIMKRLEGKTYTVAGYDIVDGKLVKKS